MLNALLGGILCVSVSVAVFVFGLSAVDRSKLNRRQTKDTHKARPMLTSGPAFTPLELAPVDLKWPSEIPSHHRRLPELPWPSETWTDNFFARGPLQQAAPDEPERALAPQEPREPREQRTQREERKREKKPQLLPAVEVAPPIDTSLPMRPEEVARWAAEKGLAVAVEEIRARTGWDFQRAAKYLATVLRQHKERS